MQFPVEQSDTGWRTIAMAGIAGGLAEIAWVAAWSTMQGADGWRVARAVTAALAPALGASPLAAPAGIFVHLGLSLLLAAAFVRTVPASWVRRRAPLITSALTALAGVWAVNFFLVLPVLDPSFARLLPYPVTFVSKVLFGTAMSLVLAARADTKSFRRADQAVQRSGSGRLRSARP